MKISLILLVGLCVFSAFAIQQRDAPGTLSETKVTSTVTCDEVPDKIVEETTNLNNCSVSDPVSLNGGINFRNCILKYNNSIIALQNMWISDCVSPSVSKSPASSFQPEPACTCLAWGGVQPNTLVFEDCSVQSDTEGALYCGGDAKLAGHSVGDKLDSNYSTADVLVVGGKCSWYSGRLYIGNAVCGETDIHSSVNIDPSQVVVDGNRFNFDGARTYYENLSARLCQKPATGTIQLSTGTTVVTSGNVAHDVYYLNCSDLKAASSLSFEGLSSSATAVVNILGATCSFRMGGIDTPNNGATIFNFCEATNLQLSNTPIPGQILAPFAAIYGNGGVVQGQIVGRSFSGQTQQNLDVCTGCLSSF